MWNDTDNLQISEGKYWNLLKVNIGAVLQECVFIVHRVCKWTPGLIYIHHCLHLLFGRCPQPSLHDGCHWGRIHVFQTLCASILWPEIERCLGITQITLWNKLLWWNSCFLTRSSDQTSDLESFQSSLRSISWKDSCDLGPFRISMISMSKIRVLSGGIFPENRA